MASGKPSAMRTYNEFQVKQLTRLIEVTRTGLSRPDRQKVRQEGPGLQEWVVCVCRIGWSVLPAWHTFEVPSRQV
jgi:hypothetical protein